MKVQEIEKVIYIGKTNELYIKFVAEVFRGYDTVAFTNVPIETVKDFKQATDRELYFDQYIRTKFPYYGTHIAFAEVQSPSYYNQSKDPMTYEEYCAKLAKETAKKDLAAMNALA